MRRPLQLNRAPVVELQDGGERQPADAAARLRVPQPEQHCEPAALQQPVHELRALRLQRGIYLQCCQFVLCVQMVQL